MSATAAVGGGDGSAFTTVRNLRPPPSGKRAAEPASKPTTMAELVAIRGEGEAAQGRAGCAGGRCIMIGAGQSRCGSVSVAVAVAGGPVPTVFE
jgi:hypothetical protein